MQLFLITVFVVCLLTGGMCLALALGRRRRCACGESRRVAKLIENRKKAARAARHYDPATVDPNALPLIDSEVGGK